jgi:hypothetical protein
MQFVMYISHLLTISDLEAMDLYSRRSQIDWLAIVRPFVVMGVWKAVDWAKQQVMGTKVRLFRYFNLPL